MKLSGQNSFVYVIVVTFNGESWIEKCLNSINSAYNIIVVDNNSTDGTKIIVKDKFKNIQLIELERNLGFGKANNIGLRLAYQEGGQFFFLLNQDAFLINDPIEKLIEIQKENTDFGILSPLQLNGTGTSIDVKFEGYLYSYTSSLISELIFKKEKEIYEVKFVNAAAWLISRKCLETVGLFDPLFDHYGEDDDFCNRARFFGFKTGVAIHSFVHHDRPQNGETDLKNYKKEYKNILIRAKNVNKIYLGNLMGNYWFLFKNIMVSIKKNKRKNLLIWLKCTGAFTVNLFKIRNAYNLSKKSGSFLDT